MPNTIALRKIAIAALLVCATQMARAQCLDWRTFPHVGPTLTGQVLCLKKFDDGSGQALYLGGHFLLPDSSTPLTPIGLLRWDGKKLMQVGNGPGLDVTTLLPFDDGTGPALYATAHQPARVMKWNGSTWQQVGGVMNNAIACLAVHDDGSGPRLYAGGTFTTAEGVSAQGVVKWTGSAWAPLANGPASSPNVRSLASYDDGTGPALYAAGNFPGAIYDVWNHIVKWSGGAWTSVGNGTNELITALVPWDDGSGPSLFVLGNFTSPTQHVARLNGSGWHAVGSGLGTFPLSGQLLDDSSGEKLWLTTSTTMFTDGLPGVQSWNGSTWSAGPPVSTDYCDPQPLLMRALGVFDDGAGPHLFAGSTPGGAGPLHAILSRANGGIWEPVDPPVRGLNGSLRALHAFDDGSGPALYAGGSFCQADETSVWNVARFDGTTWHPVGTGPEALTTFVTYDHGSGPMFLAGSARNAQLSQWTGTSWSSWFMTQNQSDSILAMQQFGPDLYVGGAFSFGFGASYSPSLMRYHPGTGFVSVGTYPSSGVIGAVNALTTLDDGNGVALYVGGSFTTAGGIAANRIIRWDGTTWSPLGSGTDALVDSLVAFDDGSGMALYAGGTFTNAGGVPASCVARWNGSSWSALGAGLNAQVLTLGVFDDGSGSALYAGGNFTASGSDPMERVARWNGTTWSALGGSVSGTVWAMRAHDDGTGIGPQLFVAGVFDTAGTESSTNIAAWRGCGGKISKFCFGDGSDGACPCGNSGLSDRGCNNSAGTGGARLNATGTTSPDTLVLHAGGELPNSPTLVFQGSTSLSQPILFGDGLRCVGGNLKRLFTTNAVGGAVTFPGTGQVSVSARSAALGDPLVPGSVRSYQTWYRDPNLGFCAPPSGDAWNLSNAVRIVW